MTREDDFKRHGKRLITYDLSNIRDAAKCVYDLLGSKGERPVVSIGVAAFLIHVHMRMTKSDLGTVLELVKQFLAKIEEESPRGN